MIFYQKLKELRENSDKSQKEIAEILQSSQQQYSRWESGKFQMPIENYKIIAKYYNVSLDYITGLISEPHKLYTEKSVMNFPQKIKSLRDVHGLSQQTIADLLNIDRKTYNRLENGKHEPKLETAMALADFYGVSLDYIVGYTDKSDKEK